MVRNMELLAETRVRPKNEITVPGIIRDILNISPGDMLRFEMVEGNICLCKVVTKKINHSCGGRDNED